MPYIEMGEVGELVRAGTAVDIRNLRSGELTAQSLVLAGGTKGILRSQNYDAATTGWAIFGDGKAFFYGDVTVGGKFIVTDGTESLVIDPTGWGSTQVSIAFEVGATTLQPGITGQKTDGGLLLSAGGDVSPGKVKIFKSRIDFEVDSADRWTMDANFLTRGSGTGGIRLGPGGATAPTLSFVGDTNTGLYWGTADNPVIAAGGIRVADWHNNGGTGQSRVGAGLASKPSLTFIADSNTGMYWISADLLGFSSAGNRRFSIGSQIQGRQATGHFFLKNDAAPSAASPAYSFFGDTDIGMYRASANILGFATEGTEVLKCQLTRVFLTGARNDTTGAAANTFIQSSDGRIYRSTASARRYKKYIADAPIDLSRFHELQARQFQYKNSHHKPDQVFWGLVAEEVFEVYPKMVDRSAEDKGPLENVRYANLTVVAIEKIKELERRIDELFALR